MGVPALFRWLSKKYPKIVLPVVEEEEVKVPDEDGKDVVIPIDITLPNPNGVEFDNLYLDMNGIVHPCTHPEGKPPPETEEEMMLEVFKYTDRIVNMIRPRKLLLMAIDGVAPRAKMNQQRSRRFRSAQEAKQKEETRQESIALWQSMGQTITEEEKSKIAWDSNAITPGTSFMDLLAISLRYWVVQKMNTDPGWKNLQVIISDASVPGEGEHKIMDFIRRQRTNVGHDPNTQHVIYGLDADLIMLALATHEINFRVLREDVFFQDGSATACRICGQEGHFAAQCTGQKKIKTDENDVKKKPVEKKPFIFLDVSILREYLEIELNVPQSPFPFNLEQSIDDWVLLIFFVGNDFLPHLPSLEIREGAIDTLLKIWKEELPRMGGYLTNHGQLVYSRAEIIIEGLAKREDEIFRRRRETEERQDQNAKRRKIEAEAAKANGNSLVAVTPSPALQLSAPPIAPPAFHGLPAKPNFDSFEGQANFLGFGSSSSSSHTPAAIQAIGGSAHDWVANRRAIRMANMSAAELLKAEMAALSPIKSDPKQRVSAPTYTPPISSSYKTSPVISSEPVVTTEKNTSYVANNGVSSEMTGTVVPTTTEMNLTTIESMHETNSAVNSQSYTTVDDFISESITSVTEASVPINYESVKSVFPETKEDVSIVPSDLSSVTETATTLEGSPQSIKRKFDDIREEEENTFEADDDDESPPDSTSLTLKVNPDGTVEQEDTVKLWEPGYKERYYRQKFGVELSDTEFRKNLTKSYIEGLTWVLVYYYQGTPSWNWFYPYHFAPFAADFVDVKDMVIKFDLGQPFKPFEQLMGVFPPASRKQIPEAFQGLMVDEDSPIIDFYPETFDIDMNGKKMAWQGVALLPFLDEKRLLDALAPRYPNLKEDEVRRNKWGSNLLYVYEEHPLFPSMESLYTKRKSESPITLDVQLSKGISGSVLADSSCIPGSTYYSPLSGQSLPDISDDRSISALYYYPRQLRPHRSVLLPGIRKPSRVLSSADVEFIRNGGRGRGRGYANGGRPNYNIGRSNNAPPYDNSYKGNTSWTNDRGYADRPYSDRRNDYSSYGNAPPSRSYYPPADYRESNEYRGRGGTNSFGHGSTTYGASYPPAQPISQSYTQTYNYNGYAGSNNSNNGNNGYNNYGGYGNHDYGQNARGGPPTMSYNTNRGRGRGRY